MGGHARQWSKITVTSDGEGSPRCWDQSSTSGLCVKGLPAVHRIHHYEQNSVMHLRSASIGLPRPQTCCTDIVFPLPLGLPEIAVPTRCAIAIVDLQLGLHRRYKASNPCVARSPTSRSRGCIGKHNTTPRCARGVPGRASFQGTGTTDGGSSKADCAAPAGNGHGWLLFRDSRRNQPRFGGADCDPWMDGGMGPLR